MQRKADFAVNSGAIDRKSQRSDAPSGGMRAAQRVLQTLPRENGTYLSLFPVIPGLTHCCPECLGRRLDAAISTVFSFQTAVIPAQAGIQ
jgi:hypothetical protein